MASGSLVVFYASPIHYNLSKCHAIIHTTHANPFDPRSTYHKTTIRTHIGSHKNNINIDVGGPEIIHICTFCL